MGALESTSCSAVCTYFTPPEDKICEYIVQYSGFCKKFNNAPVNETCTLLGFCGSPCECGVCTNATAGPEGRCLGAPNDCGHSLTPPPVAAFQTADSFTM